MMKTKLIVMVTALILILGNEIAHAMCGAAMGASTDMATTGSMKFMGTNKAVGPIAMSGGGMGGGSMGGGGMGSSGMGGGGTGGGGTDGGSMGGGGMGGGGMGSSGMGGSSMGGGNMGSGNMDSDSMGSGHGNMEQIPGNPSGQTEDETNGTR
jgi:hypothetical protein